MEKVDSLPPEPNSPSPSVRPKRGWAVSAILLGTALSLFACCGHVPVSPQPERPKATKMTKKEGNHSYEVHYIGISEEEVDRVLQIKNGWIVWREQNLVPLKQIQKVEFAKDGIVMRVRLYFDEKTINEAHYDAEGRLQEKNRAPSLMDRMKRLFRGE